MFILANKDFFNSTTEIYSWKSNEMLKESIENITTSDNNLTSLLIVIYYQMQNLMDTI